MVAKRPAHGHEYMLSLAVLMVAEVSCDISQPFKHIVLSTLLLRPNLGQRVLEAESVGQLGACVHY